nr:unnamed protein product [Spirometra erinaceieuropaei]
MEPQLNFAVVGESGVGKSALVSRFVTGTFSDQQPTHSISRPVARRDLSGTIIRFDFADLSGRPEYRALIRGMLKNADAIVLCFDVSNQNSFEQLDIWMDEIKKYRANSSLLTLAGLKTDRSDRVILTDAGKELAKKKKCSYMEASSKDGTGVDEIFMTLASSLSPADKDNEKGFLCCFC